MPGQGLFRNLLKAIGSFIGYTAGSVEGVVDVTRHLMPDHPSEDASALRHQDIRFEQSDINPRGVFIAGAAVIVGLWIASALLFFPFSFLRHHLADVSPPPLPVAEHGNPMPPEPRLQESPRQDLKAMRAREDWDLHNYSWVDRNKGKVAIPIERAMQLIAQRGLPPQNTLPNATLTPPQAGTRTTGFQGKVEPEPR